MNPYVLPGILASSNVVVNIVSSVICEQMKVNFSQLKEKCRLRPVCESRHLIYFFSIKYFNKYQRFKLPYMELSALFNQDHAMVNHALYKISDMLDVDNYFKDVFDKMDCEILEKLEKHFKESN